MVHVFTWELLAQWRHLLVLIEDYPYIGMEYRGDPEMSWPPGQVEGPNGKYT